MCANLGLIEVPYKNIHPLLDIIDDPNSSIIEIAETIK